MTVILGNVHDDMVTSAVTIPSAGTGSPAPGSAAPSTGDSLQMVTAQQRQPREPADKVVKMTVDATTDEIASELQEALKG